MLSPPPKPGAPLEGVPGPSDEPQASLEGRGLGGASTTARWYLGFDCATKTFAYSLSRIDLKAYLAARLRLQRQILAVQELLRRAERCIPNDQAAAAALQEAAAKGLLAIDTETRSFIQLAEGETVDLFPGRADESVSTVERIRGVVRCVADRVRPAVQRAVPPDEAGTLQVVVEYQMGPNAPARTVAAALIALFAEEDVIIVGPSLKNKIAACEKGRYCYFAERYSNSYGANKAHAKYNFAQIESAFGTHIPATQPLSLRGHIADSFMQVLGHLILSADDERGALRF